MYGNLYGTQQIVRVNGENGARTYQMMPNSSALLLDETAPLVWLAQTGGAGYKTVTPFKIEPYVPEPEPDFKDILKRIERLEGRLNESDIAKNGTGSNEPIRNTKRAKEPEPQRHIATAHEQESAV